MTVHELLQRKAETAPAGPAPRRSVGTQRSIRPIDILDLQRPAGNRAVIHVLRQLAEPVSRPPAGGAGETVQRTRVKIGEEDVPGTEEENTGLFREFLSTCNREQLPEILVALGEGGSAWDREMAVEAAAYLDRSDLPTDLVEEEVGGVEEEREGKRSKRREPEEKREERRERKKPKREGEVKGVEEEREGKREIEWDKTVRGRLVLDDGGWWVKTTNSYRMMNEAEIPAEELKVGAYVMFRRAKYDTALEYGVLATKVGETELDGTVPPEAYSYVVSRQAAAQNAEAFKRANTGKRNRYTPEHLDQKYEVKWNQMPAKTIRGAAEDRNMVKSLDTTYAQGRMTIPGEDFHAEELWEEEPLHGNKVRVTFGLFYATKEGRGFARGKVHTYGSGKTESHAETKHRNADEIATMLVDSGQIKSVNEYNDEKHSHSEQQMIVELSRDLSVFDKPMKEAVEAGATKILALVVDLYSNPNTVCDDCHPSLATFLTRSDWKDQITQRLRTQDQDAKIDFASPEVILRVSSNKPFSASATRAVKAAKKSYDVNPGDAEVHFVERVPYGRY